MIRETYKGRKLTARAMVGRVHLTVNGVAVYPPVGRSERAALDQIHRDIDAIGAKPVDGNAWGAHWYEPGSYEICPAGYHPQRIGGQCQHFTCIRDRASAS